MFAGSVHILCHTSYNVWEKSFINLISHPKLVKKKAETVGGEGDLETEIISWRNV